MLLLLQRGHFQARQVGPDRALLNATTLVWALYNTSSNISLSKNSVGLYQVREERGSCTEIYRAQR